MLILPLIVHGVAVHQAVNWENLGPLLGTVTCSWLAVIPYVTYRPWQLPVQPPRKSHAYAVDRGEGTGEALGASAQAHVGAGQGRGAHGDRHFPGVQGNVRARTGLGRRARRGAGFHGPVDRGAREGDLAVFRSRLIVAAITAAWITAIITYARGIR